MGNGEDELEQLRDAVLGRLHEREDADKLFLSTIRDAVDLAGEQVQSQRLRMLEKPPGLAAHAFFIDVLLTLALGPGLNAAFRILTAKTVGGILRLRSASAGPGVKTSTRPFEFVDLSADGLLKAQRVAGVPALSRGALTSPGSSEAQLWSALPMAKAAGESIREVASGRVREIAQYKVKAAAQAQRPSDGGDAADVAVKRAVTTFVRLQEPAISANYRHVRGQVEKSEDGDFLQSLKEYLIDWDIESTLAAQHTTNTKFEEALSRLFEAVIWAQHFGGADGIGRAAIISKADSNGDLGGRREFTTSYVRRHPGVKLKVSRDMAAYFAARFPHPKGDGTESFLDRVIRQRLENGIAPIGFEGKRTAETRPASPENLGTYTVEDEAIVEMLAYMGSLEAKLSEITRAVRSTGLELIGPTEPKKP